jgi:WD40 repeat protein
VPATSAYRRLNPNQRTHLGELKGHGGPVYSAAFSPDGARIVTV